MLRRLACGAAAVVAGVLPLAPAGAAGDPVVTVVVHVPLARPHALRGESWFCSPGLRSYQTAAPEALLRSYVRELSRHGSVRENVGLGTWMVGTIGAADVAFMAVDHVTVRTRLHAARALLPPLLTRLRSDFDQREALGEIFGGAFGSGSENRTKIDVVVPFAHADYATLRRLNLIFGDRGRGGASQYADRDGVHVYSSAPRGDARRLERELEPLGLPFTAQPSTFVTVDAPPCPPAAR